MTLVLQPKQPLPSSRTHTEYYRSLSLALNYFSENSSAVPFNTDLSGLQSYGYAPIAVTTQPGTAPGRLPLQLHRAAKELSSFAALPADWDSYGAPPVSKLAVNQAIALLDNPFFGRLLPRHGVRLAAFPRRDGGVQLDVDGGPYALEVVIAEDGAAEYTFFAHDNIVVAELSSLAEAVDWYEQSRR